MAALACRVLSPNRQWLVRIARSCLASIGVLLALPSLAALPGLLQRGNALQKDFGQEYLLARAMADRVDPYLPIRDLAARYLSPTGLLDKPFPTPHPPTVGPLFMPFLLVDYPTAVQVWSGLELASLLLAVILAVRVAALPMRTGWTLVLAIALLGWTPVIVDVGLAQVTLVMLALLSGAELLLVRQKGVVGGALLGLGLALKPLAWPWLLVLAWQRRFSTVVAAVAVLGGLLAVAVLRVGIAPVAVYVTQVMPSLSASYAAEPTNISLWTVGTRLLPASADATRVIDAGVPVLLLLTTFAWIVAARPSLRTALNVVLCISVAISPLDWEYDLVLLILPAMQSVAELRSRSFPPGATLLGVLIAAGLYLPLSLWRLQVHLALAPTLLALGIAALLVWATRRSTACAPRQLAA